MRRKIAPWIVPVVWVAFFLARPAHAYIDPGTGSYVLQTLLGILFALGYALKIYWRHVWGFLRHAFSRKRPPEKLEK